MRIHAILVAVLLLACTKGKSGNVETAKSANADPDVDACHAKAKDPSAKVITAKELAGATVLGALGEPLGVVMTLEGTIVDGASLHDKRHQGSYLLRVDSVAGHPVEQPVVMDFSGPLPNNDFALYEWKTGKKTGTLDEAQIADLKVGYVSMRVVVYGYETGGFGGVPKCLPRDEIWQDTNFGFHTSLVVLQRLK